MVHADAQAHASSASAPSAPRQLALLLGLWWRHMRRRARRPGEAPRMSGVPTTFLINLLVTGYTIPVVWSAVARSLQRDQDFFAWHMGGVLLIAFGNGTSQAAAGLQVRGMRDDSFLEALPLTTFARLGSQLADGFIVLPFAIVVPLAGLAARGVPWWAAPLPVLLGMCAYVACFVLAQAVVAWARVWGPPPTARRCAYAGIAIMLAGAAGVYVPVGRLLDPSDGGVATLVTRYWLGGALTVLELLVLTLGLLWSAYRFLLMAERAGFDRLDTAPSAIKASTGPQSRNALEWQMVVRQGGRALLIMFVPMAAGTLWIPFRWFGRVPVDVFVVPAAFLVYLGALLVIGQAGRAARADLMARAFLAPLPLAPYQVLDGKVRALRKLLVPVLLVMAALGGIAMWRGEPSFAFRIAVASVSLFVMVEGAISVAFLSNGVGVIGVGGGQASSSFSTQLLMMPLLATVVAADAWAATVAGIATLAVTWEARRAAHKSVRWLDDPADELERETTVWRALIATTAFFAVQAMTARMLDLADVPQGYTLAGAFGASALLLALLTYRNGERFARPRFLPRDVWWWPLGALAGGLSGTAALGLAKLLPARIEAEPHAFGTGEAIALAITLVVMAPLAEEYFFRGWLQRAIEQDLPEQHKRWAFALGALAFALAHIGMYGLPQLMLGLLAGALYAGGGGLWPAILAHAIHNGVVLLAAR